MIQIMIYIPRNLGIYFYFSISVHLMLVLFLLGLKQSIHHFDPTNFEIKGTHYLNESGVSSR